MTDCLQVSLPALATNMYFWTTDDSPGVHVGNASGETCKQSVIIRVGIIILIYCYAATDLSAVTVRIRSLESMCLDVV